MQACRLARWGPLVIRRGHICTSRFGPMANPSIRWAIWRSRPKHRNSGIRTMTSTESQNDGRFVISINFRFVRHKLAHLLASASLVAYSIFGIARVTAQASFHQIAKFGTYPLGQVAWNPDGTILAVLNLSTVILYTPTFKQIAEFRDEPSADQIAWSPDGNYLAGVGQSLWVWNVATHNRRVLW